MREFTKSSFIISKLMEKIGLNDEKKLIYFYWEKIVGEKLAKKIQLVGIKNGCLLVKPSSPAYYHQMKLSQSEWIKKINDYLGNDKIKGIKTVNL